MIVYCLSSAGWCVLIRYLWNIITSGSCLKLLVLNCKQMKMKHTIIFSKFPPVYLNTHIYLYGYASVCMCLLFPLFVRSGILTQFFVIRHMPIPFYVKCGSVKSEHYPNTEFYITFSFLSFFFSLFFVVVVVVVAAEILREMLWLLIMLGFELNHAVGEGRGKEHNWTLWIHSLLIQADVCEHVRINCLTLERQIKRNALRTFLVCTVKQSASVSLCRSQIDKLRIHRQRQQHIHTWIHNFLSVFH